MAAPLWCRQLWAALLIGSSVTGTALKTRTKNSGGTSKHGCSGARGCGRAIGIVHHCSTPPDTADPVRIGQYVYAASKAAYHLQERPAGFPEFGSNAGALYVRDRCWSPLSVCLLSTSPNATRSVLIKRVPTDNSFSARLYEGRYIVVLGGGPALGAASTTSFASELEDRLGMLVINLSRGGAGPHYFLKNDTWPLIAPILRHAHAVIVQVMAGRSSPNSAFAGKLTSVNSNAEFIESLRGQSVREHNSSAAALAARLLNESLAHAKASYIKLARRLRHRIRSTADPRLLLLWFSSCSMIALNETSCKWGDYPHWIRSSAYLKDVARAMPATLVDASSPWNTSSLIPTDKCTSCTPRDTRICNIDQARDESRTTPPYQTCSTSCGWVVQHYYGTDAAHRHAASVLTTALTSP